MQCKFVHVVNVHCTSRRKVKKQENIRLKDLKTLEYFVKDVRENKKSKHMSFSNAIWVMSSGVVGHGGQPMPTSASGRFVQFTWCFLLCS